MTVPWNMIRAGMAAIGQKQSAAASGICERDRLGDTDWKRLYRVLDPFTGNKHVAGAQGLSEKAVQYLLVEGVAFEERSSSWSIVVLTAAMERAA